jgi:predicted flap endonuclease-1-like 5' DNA nuclease/regulator of replication initiation timing
MPEITVIHIALFAAAVLVGIVVGWISRSGHAEREKSAINAGWQEQLESREAEHGRLAQQNKGLMEQVSQYQASSKDSQLRAKELSDSLKEAFERRDALQREIKDIRSTLEASVAERVKIKSDFDNQLADNKSTDRQLAEKDARIAKLTKELENWQNRLPPLVERFRERNEDAQQLEAELAKARDRIEEMESLLAGEPEPHLDPTQTRVEPVRNPDSLTDGLDASNEPIEDEHQNNAEDIAFNSLRDNLKRIKGVGPAIEKTLNEMGIFRFNQIAEMSEYDIDRVANRLKGFRTRIYREDWMGQARNLHDEKLSG